MNMSYYCVVPSHIILNGKLTSNEKLLYAIITSLIDKDGKLKIKCSNLGKYFVRNDEQPNEKTLMLWLQHLAELEYIYVVKENDLFITLLEKGGNENNNPPKQPIAAFEQVPTYTKEIKEIIEYLNTKTGKRFTASGSDTVKFISSRLKEGYKVSDFKRVIDNKCKDIFFINNPKYLCPTTLFRPGNFEKYLNEQMFTEISINTPSIGNIQLSNNIF